MAGHFLDQDGLDALVENIKDMSYMTSDKIKDALGSANIVNAAKDYVIARGTSGHWEYIRFASGIAICAGYTTQSRKGGSAWGGIYYDSGKTGGEAYPFTFKNRPSFFTNIVGGNGEYWLTCCNDGSTTNAPHVYALTAAKNSSTIPVIRYQLAIGWVTT